MNLDKLKSDIANNEICVLVNGQPETVEYKQWLRRVILRLEFFLHVRITPKEVNDIIQRVSNGESISGKVDEAIFNLLDY